MTYVDDMRVVGDQHTVQHTMEKIQGKWRTSVPDSISEAPIRFVGMEIAKLKDPETGRDVWYVFQASYIKDLIAKAVEDVKKRMFPSYKIRVHSWKRKVRKWELRRPGVLRSRLVSFSVLN